MVNPLNVRLTTSPARSSAADSDRPVVRDDVERGSPRFHPARRAFRRSTLAMGVGAGLLLGAVVGRPAATAADDPATTESSATEADSLKALKSDIERLANRLKSLKDRAAALHKPGSSPDPVASLQGRIDALAKSTEAVASLVKQAGNLDDRAGAVDKQVAELREQVGKLKVMKEKERAEATSGAEFAKAVEMFKGARYKEASVLFRTLTEARPDDARAWYYAGLSHGLATSQWTGETRRLVNEGVKREKAGTPDKAKIDASLASVTVRDVKNWLDSIRKTARQ